MLEFFLQIWQFGLHYGDSEKSGNSFEYGDLHEYGDAGESCDSIKFCFFSGDFGDLLLYNYVIPVNLGSFYLIL